jgi:hypothetical protein
VGVGFHLNPIGKAKTLREVGKVGVRLTKVSCTVFCPFCPVPSSYSFSNLCGCCTTLTSPTQSPTNDLTRVI